MRRLLASFALALCAATCALADSDNAHDCEGCRDHPMLARYPGSVLVGADQTAFEEAALPTAAAGEDDDYKTTLPSTLKLTGKRTRLYYMAPKERSALEVFTNYREALDKAGMTTLWTCADEECGKNFATAALGAMHLELDNTREATIGFSDAERPRYLVAELKREPGDLHVAVLAADLSERQRAGVYVLVIESKPMDRDLVALDSAALDRSILGSGKAIVYGIHFDFDKADLRPDSKPQLDEIAKLLNSEPALKLRITGYTDNQGSADYNRQLSQRRAQAIVAALVGDYAIDASRLGAAGMGADASVASNDSEDGRAKNRRVELVKQ